MICLVEAVSFPAQVHKRVEVGPVEARKFGCGLRA